MKKWILKAIVQKIISYLPLRNKINYFFQKYVTKGIHLTNEYFNDRLEHAKEHINSYQHYIGKKIPSNCLEIGTGWYPIVPIYYYLVGVDKIYTIDISSLISKKSILTTVTKFFQNYYETSLNSDSSINIEKVETLNNIIENFNNLTLEQLLISMNIHYLVSDARKIPLPSDSIDLISSNNTFEHIYPEILDSILLEFIRIIKKQDGVMSHFIDMTDHFAHIDKSINIYNFLQFSNKQWKWIDNSIQPQNRLRIDDYRKIYIQRNIPITEEKSRQGDLAELKTIKIAEKYKDKLLDELAISHCHFISVINNK